MTIAEKIRQSTDEELSGLLYGFYMVTKRAEARCSQEMDEKTFLRILQQPFIPGPLREWLDALEAMDEKSKTVPRS